MKTKLLTAFLFLVTAISAVAIPARKGTYVYTQPDGSSFTVRVTGDEFSHITTTVDGRPIVRQENGWYCYASFDAEGRSASTGARVGLDAPQGATAIPHTARLRLSAPRRAAAGVRRQRAAASTSAFTSAHNTSHNASTNATGLAANVSPATKASKEIKGIVILAQFPDLKFNFGRGQFVSLLNEKGYSVNGAEGSAVDYFNDQFGGAASFSFDVGPVVTLSRNYAYYGENNSKGEDKHPAEAVYEACILADKDVDFSKYDINGDGVVDNVFVFVAGGTEADGAGDDHIWAHSWAFIDALGTTLTLDGVTIDTYALSSELMYYQSMSKRTMTSIGSFCHEFSHVLGLMDLYDTDYEDSDGKSEALWFTTSLMDGGNYNNDGRTPPHYNAVEMEQLGLGTYEEFRTGQHTLAPITSSRKYMRMDSDIDGEYYLLECRALEGWDKYIGGSGMLIYHVDRGANSAGYSPRFDFDMAAYDRWWYNEVNCRPEHQCVDLIEPISNAQSANQVFWPYTVHNEFGPETSPSLSFWSGECSEYAFKDIQRSGSDVTFTVSGLLSISAVEAFQDAAIIQWTAARDAVCTVTYKYDGGPQKSISVHQYAPGLFSCTLEGLQTGSSYDFTVSDQNGDSVKSSFNTKSYYSDGYPFIYLNSAKRYTDGKFEYGTTLPLRVYNAEGAQRVRWYLDGKQIQPEGNGYYTLYRGGTLKAVIDYSDGSTDIITKTITVQ